MRPRWCEGEALCEHAQHHARLQQRQVLSQAVAGTRDERQECVRVSLVGRGQEALRAEGERLRPPGARAQAWETGLLAAVGWKEGDEGGAQVRPLVHPLQGQDDLRAPRDEAAAQHVVGLGAADP